MSTLQIEERITVKAPPQRVFRFLLDPARVAACLPGAKLDGTEGEDTFLGTMKVKVGPVLMEMKGKATMSEVDTAGRRVTLSGTGNDKAGGGSARMDMKCQVLETEGGAEIVVIAEVHLAGKLVRFGRGMMEGISKQLFKQFAERVHTAVDQMEDEEEEEEEETGGESEGSEAEGGEAEGGEPGAEAAKEPEAKAEEKAPSTEAAADKAPPADAPTAEKAATEKALAADSTSAEKALPADSASSGKAPAENALAADSASSGKAPAENALAADSAPPEKVPPEKAPAADSTSSAESPAANKAPSAPETAADKAPATDSASAETPPAAAKKDTPAASANPEKQAASKPAAPRKKKPSTKKAIVPVEDNAPLDAGSLVWAAIWAWIKGLFARLFGRKKD